MQNKVNNKKFEMRRSKLGILRFIRAKKIK